MNARIGSICVGYGGLEMAIASLLPIDPVWHVEFDPAASKVLQAHWPSVPNCGDVTKVDWAQVASVDIFAGGIPCQGWSLAGKRKGSDDERDLWPVRKFEDDGITARRGALDAIRELRPRLIVIENVPGLMTGDSGQAFATVLADLDALGYAVSWTVVGACKVGACHHRHRVFIAATLVDVQVPMSDPIAHRSGGGWMPAQSVLFGDAQAVKWPASGFTSAGSAWELPSDTCGADGLTLPTPRAIDGKSGQQTLVDGRTAGDRGPRLGDIGLLLPTPRTSDTNGAGIHGTGGLDLRTAVAMLPTPLAQDAERNRTSPGDLARKSPALEAVVSLLPTPTATSYGSNQSPSVGASVRPSLEGIAQLLPTPRASDGVKGGPNQRGSSGDVMLPAAVQPERFGKYAAAVHRHEVAFGLPAPDPTEPGCHGKPRLSPAFPEWMQSLPAGYLTDVVERKDALRIAGNGVHWPAAAFALSTLPTFRAAVAALTMVGVSA